MSEPIIEVHDLSRTFRTGRGMFQRGQEVQAVKQVSLQVPAGSTFGLVGESGSGKTTVAKIVCGLESIDSGNVRVADFDLGRLRRRDLKPFRRLTQMVFQDPLASLNPYWRIGSLVAEGMRVHDLCPRSERRDRVAFLLESCGLPADVMDRHPHEFSGGQRQRISIARALAVEGSARSLDTLALWTERFRSRFLHDGGWHEVLGPGGEVLRADMPSTTPYHLLGAYQALQALVGRV